MAPRRCAAALALACGLCLLAPPYAAASKPKCFFVDQEAVEGPRRRLEGPAVAGEDLAAALAAGGVTGVGDLAGDIGEGGRALLAEAVEAASRRAAEGENGLLDEDGAGDGAEETHDVLRRMLSGGNPSQLVHGCLNNGHCVEAEAGSGSHGQGGSSPFHSMFGSLPRAGADNVCKCKPGWGARDCSMAICDNVTVPGAFFDESCRDVPVYGSADASVSNQEQGCYRCGSNGNCTTPNQCSCNLPWGGPTCAQEARWSEILPARYCTGVDRNGETITGCGNSATTAHGRLGTGAGHCVDNEAGEKPHGLPDIDSPTLNTSCVCSMHPSTASLGGASSSSSGGGGSSSGHGGNHHSGHNNHVKPHENGMLTGWTGSFCETPICVYGTWDPTCELDAEAWGSTGSHKDTNPTHKELGCYRCANGGVCTAPDTCHCPIGFHGTNCELEGLPADGDCPPGFEGHHCKDPVCEFPKTAEHFDFVGCFGASQCIHPQNCSCPTTGTSGHIHGRHHDSQEDHGEAMYIGTDCSVPVCDAAINGAWYDRECEDRPSYIGGRYQSNAGCYKCPNGGFCKDFNTCQCAPGWIGDDCRTHAPPPPPPPPSHWGPNGPPDCETGYRGVNCSFPICNKHWADGSTQPCKFGACKSPGNCTCLAHKSFLPATQPGSGIPDNAITGYWGMSCSIPICAQGFFDAECTDNPKAAQTGQKGCWRCANGGECWAPDQCRNCDDGWGGFDCKKKVSEHSASNVASGSTSHPHGCKTGWTGPLCETPVCDCHEHGTCIEPGRCQCATYESVLHEHVAHAPKGLTGWSGKNCQTPLCVQSCHNGGHCNGPDTCECTAAYYGYDCSVLKGPHWQDDESGSVKHGRPGLHGASHSKQGSNGGLAAIQNGDDTPGWSGTQIMWVSLGGVVMFAAAFFAIVYVVRSQRISKGAAKPKFVQLELAEEGGGAASTRL